MGYIHRMECNSALKRKKILAHATIWMNPEDVMLSEITPGTKEQMLYNSTYMMYLQ